MPQSQGESLLAILDELQALLKQSKQMPMSSSILVNKAEALDLLQSALVVVPAQVAEADEIVAGARGVVERAEADAAQVRADAERTAERQVSHDAIVAAATERAAQIVADARAKAERLMDEANVYCDRQLAQLEVELEQIGRQVKAGRTVIKARVSEVPR